MGEFEKGIQGDYEEVNKVADLQKDNLREMNIEQQADNLLSQIGELKDGNSLKLYDLDESVRKEIYYKLGLSPEVVSSATAELITNSEMPGSKKGEIAFKRDEVGRQVPDIEHSTPSGPIEFKRYWTYIPTERPSIYIRLNFASPADPTVLSSIEKRDDLEGYLKSIEVKDDAPLAADKSTAGTVFEKPKTEI
jgi:hypothetical protein